MGKSSHKVGRAEYVPDCEAKWRIKNEKKQH